MTILFKPHAYQRTATDFLSYHMHWEDTGAALWLDPGLGKTSATLQALWEMRCVGTIRRVLIVAPLRVATITWPAEIQKWGFPFRYSVIHGPPHKKKEALDTPADIYLINPEGLPWLKKELLGRRSVKPWDCCIVDEATMFKNWSAVRTKILRQMMRLFKRGIYELTGTPAPNSYIDLHSQIYFLDKGEALGKTVTEFRAKYCFQDFSGFNRWKIRPGLETEIESRVAPLVLRMSCEDYLDMPALVRNPIWVDLPPSVRSAYDRLERDLFCQLDTGADLIASSAAAAYMMCRSLVNGGAYTSEDYGVTRTSHHIHDTKVDAVQDLFTELAGKPLLVAYQFDHDRERLLKRFPGTPVICGGISPKQSETIIRDWNNRQLQLLFVQPQSITFGLNLQAGGNDLCWFGLTDQPVVHSQTNARLWRQGVSGQVRLHYLLARKTIDEAIWYRLKDKDESQSALLRAVQQYRESKA